MLNRRRFVGLASAALAAPPLFRSRAQSADWPRKPVRVVVPFTPGGSTDITARLVGNRLQEVWGQSVVVENKPGAGGNIAADMVAHSDPDGYTILISRPGTGHQSVPVSVAELRSHRGFRAGDDADHPAEPDVRAEFLAGEIGQGVHRLLPTPTRARSPLPRPATAPRCI